MWTPLLFFIVEALAFYLANVSIRYCAKGHKWETVSLDMLIAMNGFFIIKLVSEPTMWQDMAGFLAGAFVGSYVGMTSTQHLKEK